MSSIDQIQVGTEVYDVETHNLPTPGDIGALPTSGGTIDGTLIIANGYLRGGSQDAGEALDETWSIDYNGDAVFGDIEITKLNGEDPVTSNTMATWSGSSNLTTSANGEILGTDNVRGYLANILNRRYVMIGDSIGAGYNPDGNVNGWPTVFKTSFGLSDTQCYINCWGGAGFSAVGTWDNVSKSFITLLEEISTSVSDPDTITDVVVLGGYNDWSIPFSTICADKEAFINRATTLFPNCTVNVGMIGWTRSRSDDGYNAIVNIYKNSYAAYKWSHIRMRYLRNMEYVLHYDNHFCSDDIHITQDAENMLAIHLANALATGSADVITDVLPITIDTSVFNKGSVSISGGVYSSIKNENTELICSDINIQTNTDWSLDGNWIDLCNLNSNAVIYGEDFRIVNAVAIMNVSNSGSFRQAVASIRCSRRTLQIRIKLLSDTQDGWFQLPANSNIAIDGFSTVIDSMMQGY